jgi:tRNA-binding EMAP/Myf-like protein
MRDRLVVVALNLKPAKMRDVMSYGMVGSLGGGGGGGGEVVGVVGEGVCVCAPCM